MTAVVAADVVVPLEIAVLLAHVPVAVSGDAMDQSAVMQNRKVEPAAVPRNELRRVLVDAVEEALNEIAFRFTARAQRPHPEAVAVAQGT